MRDDHADLVRVAGAVSRETFEDLKGFEQDLRRWSTRINLVAPSTLSALWQRHVLDSAQLLPLAGANSRWLDIGSGGGFPGAVIAILLKERPGASITLVESNRKKAAFLASTLAAVKAPAIVLPIRVEEAWGRGLSPQVVTARALAPLSALLGLARPWLESGATGLFHKGRDYRSELVNSAADWRYDLVEHRSAIDEDSAILAISNLEVAGRS